MSTYFLVIVFGSIIILLHSIQGQASSNMEPKMQLTAYHSLVGRAEDSEVTTNLRSWRGRSTPHHKHLRTAHGILTIIGWGILLPVGVMIARYFRKFPMQWNEWYSFHVMCQSAGYVLGTLGWLIGILSGITSPKQLHSHDKSIRILGIVIFTLTTKQMLAIFWQPKKEQDREEYQYYYRKGWEICHHFLGFVLIALIIADIFQGIKDQSQASKWKWIYVGILGVLGLIALALEILRWVRSRIYHEAIELNSSMYTSSP